MQTTQDTHTIYDKNLKTSGNGVSVALAMSNLSDAKRLSDIFRKVNVIPHVYSSLDDLWEGLDDPEQGIDLVIVDVLLTSKSGRQLKHHPSLHTGKVEVSFFCKELAHPLVFSTFDIDNLGLIYGELSLTGQVKSLLSRFNRVKKLQKTNSKKLDEQDKVDKRLTGLVENLENYKLKDFYHKLSQHMMRQVDREKSSLDFFQAVSRAFESLKEIRGYSFLELSPSGHKLLSAKIAYPKFVEIPALWLGRTCSSGIEFFAQNMASQVALEFLGGDMMTLQIRGAKENPDVLAMIRVESEEMLENFPWEVFEKYLSGVYNFFQNKNASEPLTQEGIIPAWKLFSQLDDWLYGKTHQGQMRLGEWSLLGVKFEDLLKEVKRKPELRFMWKTYFSDFFKTFNRSVEESLEVYFLSPSHFVLLVKEEDRDHVFSKMKNFSHRFAYWRYFEDADIVLAKNLKPQVVSVPLSSKACLDFMAGEDFYKPGKKTDEFEIEEPTIEDGYFKRPAPTQNM